MSQPSTTRTLLISVVGGAMLLSAVVLWVSLQAPVQPPLDQGPSPLVTSVLEPEQAIEAPATPAVPTPLTPRDPTAASATPAVTEPNASTEALSLPLVSQAPPMAPLPLAQGEPDAAPATAQGHRFETQSYGEDGLKVKFRSVEDLASLVGEGHVQVLLEYPDGSRYRLPETLLQDTPGTARVPAPEFQRFIDEGRVSELVPTQELRSQLRIFQADVRFIAVLDAALRREVAEAVSRDNLNLKRTVLMISRGPEVSVLLARR